MISLFFSFLVIMFKFTFYLALFPFWLIWWFIKVVFFFMGWLDLCLTSFYASGAIRRMVLRQEKVPVKLRFLY